HIGTEGIAQERLNYFCHHMMREDFTEELLSFVDLSTLDERLRGRKIITRDYISTVSLSAENTGSGWTQCCFIENIRDDEGRLVSVIFATKSIQQDKRKELDYQAQLEEKNRELQRLLETEKHNTDIIGSLSNIFYRLYYIDLNTMKCQEVISVDTTHHLYMNTRNVHSVVDAIVHELASDDAVGELTFFTDPGTMNIRLAGERSVVCEFADRKGGWSRCTLLPVERTAEGDNVRILMGFRDITNEKAMVLKQDALIAALARSYQNVYVIDGATGEAVSYRMDRVMMDRYGQTFAVGDYAANIRAYVNGDVYPDDRYLFDGVMNPSSVMEILRDAVQYSFNYRVLRYGEVRYYQCQIVRTSDGSSDFIAAFKDIDRERRAEIAQQEKLERINRELKSEMAISMVLSNEYHSLFRIDAKTGELSLHRTDGVGLSRSLLDSMISSHDYEKIITGYIDTMVIPEDRERLRLTSTLETLRKEVPEVGLFKQGYRRLCKGQVEYYEMNVARSVDEAGHVTFIMGIRDVDAETRRQLAVSEEMETQREISQGLASEYYSVLLVDPVRDTVKVYRAEEEHGRSIASLFSSMGYRWSPGIQEYVKNVTPESAEELIHKLSPGYLLTHDEDYSFTYEMVTQDGSVFIQARVSFVTRMSGEHVVVVGTRNVDDIVKKEREQEAALRAAYDVAEAANKAKTDFLSNMSHDIRTPMNGIIGMTAIAAAHIDDKDRVYDSLQKITQASRHLLSLINEVLDMSRIESGKVDLAEEEFNISDLIDNLIAMNSSLITQHRHELKINISDVIHEDVIGDSFRLQKVFSNLMSNAVKFTPDGGKITITITERPSGQANAGCYEFVFEDNGIGMAPEFISHVFDPFARAEDGRVSRIQGTGLGMTISRNIIRMMGGDIRVESEPGKGSRFIVTVYLRLQDVSGADSSRFADLSVLAVDDDGISLDACISTLRDIGMKADGASSGEKAVEMVRTRHEAHDDYFACIIDWKMPGMNGIETTRAIRRLVGADVPIIILSAYDWSEIEQEAREAGADAFISKPLFRSRLVRTFSHILGDADESSSDDGMNALKELNLRGKRALLAEDNDLNFEIAKELLELTGLEVERASDGIEAVDAVTECVDGYYDIIFMDIQMPRMNGYDATRAIRTMPRSYTRSIPIVAITANAFAEDIHAAKTVGMNEHIAKPFDFATLVRVLTRWL
ncbi:MAG: hybrid sensor histidine kinase/response regulator, partial [Bullifex sp.]